MTEVKCHATGEKMTEGLKYESLYFKSEKYLIAHLRSMGCQAFNEASDEYILKESYQLAEWDYWRAK